MNLGMTDRDEMTMRLVHYFVTQENYQPIVVNGLENEIWLENTNKKFEVIRINNNYIHNNDQLEFDIFKTTSVIKQIKKKMFSINCSTLDILLNIGDNVDLEKMDVPKHLEVYAFNDKEAFSSSEINELFPGLKEDKIEATDDMDFFINVTKDINNKTEEKNRIYEKTFKKKSIVVTYVLIAINVIVFILSNVLGILNENAFCMYAPFVKMGEIYRLFTCMFFHVDAIHLLCNMYALYILGEQLETIIGKTKFVFVYLISGILGALLSGAINGSNVSSVGASGAIFGIMGAMLYFGYHYRLYLGNVVISQIMPVIVLNLVLGFMNPAIDNFGHIGGLIGGILTTMCVGVEGKSNKSEMVNGIIVTTLMIAFLMYMIFAR